MENTNRENEKGDVRANDAPKVAPWAEDWSTPEKLPRMSAAIPLIYMAIPFIGCVLWGLWFA